METTSRCLVGMISPSIMGEMEEEEEGCGEKSFTAGSVSSPAPL